MNDLEEKLVLEDSTTKLEVEESGYMKVTDKKSKIEMYFYGSLPMLYEAVERSKERRNSDNSYEWDCLGVGSMMNPEMLEQMSKLHR